MVPEDMVDAQALVHCFLASSKWREATHPKDIQATSLLLPPLAMPPASASLQTLILFHFRAGDAKESIFKKQHVFWARCGR